MDGHSLFSPFIVFLLLLPPSSTYHCFSPAYLIRGVDAPPVAQQGDQDLDAILGPHRLANGGTNTLLLVLLARPLGLALLPAQALALLLHNTEREVRRAQQQRSDKGVQHQRSDKGFKRGHTQKRRRKRRGGGLAFCRPFRIDMYPPAQDFVSRPISPALIPVVDWPRKLRWAGLRRGPAVGPAGSCTALGGPHASRPRPAAATRRPPPTRPAWKRAEGGSGGGDVKWGSGGRHRRLVH